MSTLQYVFFSNKNSGSTYGSSKYSFIISSAKTSSPLSSFKKSPKGSKIFNFRPSVFSKNLFLSSFVIRSISSLVIANCKSGSATYKKFSFLYLISLSVKSGKDMLRSSYSRYFLPIFQVPIYRLNHLL